MHLAHREWCPTHNFIFLPPYKRYYQRIRIQYCLTLCFTMFGLSEGVCITQQKFRVHTTHMFHQIIVHLLARFTGYRHNVPIWVEQVCGVWDLPQYRVGSRMPPLNPRLATQGRLCGRIPCVSLLSEHPDLWRSKSSKGGILSIAHI